MNFFKVATLYALLIVLCGVIAGVLPGQLLAQVSQSSRAFLQCEAEPQYITVGMTIDPGQIRYLDGHNTAYLARLYKKVGTLNSQWVPAGLTVAEFVYSLGLSVRTWRMPSGLHCSELNSIETTVGYKSIDVYIASKYKRGSCQYNSVRDHERIHVGIFQDTLEQFNPVIKSALRNLADRQESIITDQSATAIKIFQARIKTTLDPIIGNIDKILNKRNSAIDTVENYHKEQQNCLTW
jgi:hypothetical protein